MQAVKRKAGVLIRGRLFSFLPVSSSKDDGDELEAEFGGFLRHVFDLLFFILLFVFRYVYLFELHRVLRDGLRACLFGVYSRHCNIASLFLS